jgi:DNA-binding FadR family transcriptional regulator
MWLDNSSQEYNFMKTRSAVLQLRHVHRQMVRTILRGDTQEFESAVRQIFSRSGFVEASGSFRSYSFMVYFM